jgi:RHS repeat-associated protein
LNPGYNGHEASGGLVYMRNRWYDPNTGRFTQEDPIGYAGGINLYGYVGNNPVSFSDPFGLCKDENGKELPPEQCKEVSEETGENVADEAKKLTEDHQKCHTKYQSPPTGANTDDCSHFVFKALNNAGVRIPYESSKTMSTSGNFAVVAAGQQRAGDIMSQPGHVGVYSGSSDDRGRPLGYQMGNSGANLAPWGASGWFAGGNQLVYLRPLVPGTP